jgi:hypothetical protein
MEIVGLLTIVSAFFYLFFKIKSFRVKNFPYRQRWANSKASMAIGFFLLFFSINQLYYESDKTLYVVISIIFILLGTANIVLGYRAYRFFLPKAIEENEQQSKK